MMVNVVKKILTYTKSVQTYFQAKHLKGGDPVSRKRLENSVGTTWGMFG